MDQNISEYFAGATPERPKVVDDAWLDSVISLPEAAPIRDLLERGCIVRKSEQSERALAVRELRAKQAQRMRRFKKQLRSAATMALEINMQDAVASDTPDIRTLKDGFVSDVARKLASHDLVSLAVWERENPAAAKAVRSLESVALALLKVAHMFEDQHRQAVWADNVALAPLQPKKVSAYQAQGRTRRSKLTYKQVQEIEASTDRTGALAARYGVSRPTIIRIRGALRRGRTVLAREQVVEILKYATVQHIAPAYRKKAQAAQYGVSYQTIRNIHNGVSWRDAYSEVHGVSP